MIEVDSITIEDGTRFDDDFNIVDKILYHEPRGDGDRHYADIIFSHDVKIRYFDLKRIVYKTGITKRETTVVNSNTIYREVF